MVAPHWAVTAAHCLGVRVLGHVAPPSAIHLLLGYRDGAYLHHLIPDAVRVANDAASDQALPESGNHRGRDIALLHFAEALPDVLPPDPAPLAVGTGITLGGYGGDRAERLAVDPDCKAEGYATDIDRQPVLWHDCAGTRGTSGGALVTHDARGWRLAGMQVAGNKAGAGGLAIPGFVVARLLAAVQLATP